MKIQLRSIIALTICMQFMFTNSEKIYSANNVLQNGIQSEPGAIQTESQQDSDYVLALKCFSGDGVDVDRDLSYKLFQKAAGRGHQLAKSFVATQLSIGSGVKEDGERARQLYIEAMPAILQKAQEGDPVAQAQAGLLYVSGTGVVKDAQKAIMWLRKASEQKLSLAEVRLGEIYRKGLGVNKDNLESLRWYRKAAGKNNPFAQFEIGFAYSNGIGVEKNYAEAFFWYRKAAEQGYSVAQYNLGYLYYNGLGVKVNQTEGYKWYLKAANKNFATAQNNIGGILSKWYCR